MKGSSNSVPVGGASRPALKIIYLFRSLGRMPSLPRSWFFISIVKKISLRCSSKGYSYYRTGGRFPLRCEIVPEDQFFELFSRRYPQIISW